MECVASGRAQVPESWSTSIWAIPLLDLASATGTVDEGLGQLLVEFLHEGDYATYGSGGSG
jgi:hypothetical protein